MTRLTVSFLMVSALAVPAVDAAAQGKPKPGCGSNVSLKVTVAGTKSATQGYGLTGDGGGEYVDGGKGAARVTAIFQVENCTHDFTLNLHNSARSMWALLTGTPSDDRRAWFFNLDRVHSVPLTAGNDSQLDAYCASTVQLDGEGKPLKNGTLYFDNYAGCGVDENNARFVRRGGGFELDTNPAERLSFHISPIDRPALCGANPERACTSAVSYLRVYHPDENTWIVRPEPPATAIHNRDGGANVGYVPVGDVTVPFEITAIRRLQ